MHLTQEQRTENRHTYTTGDEKEGNVIKGQTKKGKWSIPGSRSIGLDTKREYIKR